MPTTPEQPPITASTRGYVNEYKIKGTGSTRSVFDGDRLVGRIHRREGTSTTVNVNFTRGTGTLRKSRVVWWVATVGDTDQRVRHSDGRVRTSESMKGWRDPGRWAGG